MQIILEGQLFQVFDTDATSETITFVPTLRPLNAANKFDSSVFSGFQMGDKVKMYTLLMDGEPVDQISPKYQKGAKLEITDRFFGDNYLITWEIYHGLAMAEKPILFGITIEDLRNNGFT